MKMVLMKSIVHMKPLYEHSTLDILNAKFTFLKIRVIILEKF